MKQDNLYLQLVSLRPISHPKEEATTNAQERVYGTTIRGCTSKVCDHEAGMEAQANCFIVNLKEKQDMADNIYRP